MSLRVVSSGINPIPYLHDTHPLLRSHVFSIFFKPANICRIRRRILFSSYGDRSRDSVSAAAADVSSSILDDELLSCVSAVRDADEALEMISDVHTLVGMQEFFYSQVPAELRSIGLALYLSVLGVGSLLRSLLISLIDLATRGDAGDNSVAQELYQKSGYKIVETGKFESLDDTYLLQYTG